MKENSIFEISLGAIISAGTSWFQWQQLAVCIIFAFIGGLAGYIGKKIAQIIYHRYLKKRIEK